MRKISFLLWIIAAIILATSALAQEDKKDENVPEGMEKIKVGPSEFVIPKGMKMEKKGDLTVMEPSAEYVARRLADIEMRLDGIIRRLERAETRENELSSKIERLYKAFSEIQNSE